MRPMRKLAAILAVLGTLIVPAVARADAPTITEAKHAIVMAYPVVVIPSHCHVRSRWTDCYVVEPLEESATNEGGEVVDSPVTFGGELHWTDRVSRSHGRFTVRKLG